MNKEELRNTIMSEQELIASRRRFGLFSQPPPLAIGDDAPYKHRTSQRGADGKPISQPRNLLAGPLKSGYMKSSYFQVPDSIYTKDPYTDEYKRQQQYYKSLHTRSVFHELQFKPSSGVKTLAQASYQYQEAKQKRKDFPQKDEAGRVKTKERNIVTNPVTKVQKDLMKFPNYISDPYERKQMLQKQQRQLKMKKMPEAIFKSMSHGERPFGKDKIVYGEDQKSKSIQKNRTMSKRLAKTLEHQAQFKPARKGHGDPIGRYPEYIGRKSQEFLPKRKIKQHENEQSWRPNGIPLSRPTPSITLNPRNIGISRRR